MPVIRFVTNKQEWITKTSNMSLPSAKKGDKVTVIYDPENPQNFVVKTSYTNLFVAIFTIGGILAILAGVYYLVAV